MIFVDTGAWAALFVAADPLHDSARKWLRENSESLITSDYVVDEVLTLLKTRFSAEASIRAGQALLGEHFSRLIYLTSDDVERAWKIFRSHADKRWSFTDCASLAAMERMRITKAFAFDKHFSQMRGVKRLPE
jgi:predicted nucleic acid-binding protein